jgi:hypothetical protein
MVKSRKPTKRECLMDSVLPNAPSERAPLIVAPENAALSPNGVTGDDGATVAFMHLF